MMQSRWFALYLMLELLPYDDVITLARRAMGGSASGFGVIAGRLIIVMAVRLRLYPLSALDMIEERLDTQCPYIIHCVCE